MQRSTHFPLLAPLLLTLFLSCSTQKQKTTKAKKVLLIGDSITKGQVSSNYVNELNGTLGHQYEFINEGVNGDLAYNVRQRIEALIQLKADYIIILIGTNDVLATFSPSATRRYTRLKNLPQAPTKERFIDNVSAIIETLKDQTSAQVAVLSLPLITEDPNHVLYKRSIEYSLSLKEISQRFGVAYLGLNEQQQLFYKNNESRPRVTYSESWHFSAKVTLLHLFTDWDSISRKYGFQLTVDHVHQNRKGATMIARQIQHFLSGQ